jgi:hypothetical protein
LSCPFYRGSVLSPPRSSFVQGLLAPALSLLTATSITTDREMYSSCVAPLLTVLAPNRDLHPITCKTVGKPAKSRGTNVRSTNSGCNRGIATTLIRHDSDSYAVSASTALDHGKPRTEITTYRSVGKVETRVREAMAPFLASLLVVTSELGDGIYRPSSPDEKESPFTRICLFSSLARC